MSAGNQVRDNPSTQRFELATEAGVAYVSYRVTGGVVSLDHTEVPDALTGRGIGATLVKGTLELIGSRKQQVIANCPFVARYIERHPEYRGILAQP